MTVKPEKEVSEALLLVEASMRLIQELEEIHRRKVADAKEAVVLNCREVAKLCDTQAERAAAIRDLYWFKRVPAGLIAQGFGLSTGRVPGIAGRLRVEYSCSRGCGGKLVETYKSINDYIEPEKRHGVVCNECKEQGRREQKRQTAEMIKQKSLQLETARREMAALSWSDYLESEAWTEITQTLLRDADFKCQLCKREGLSLGVFPAKETPQIPYEDYEKNRFFVLCNDCSNRCTEMLDPQRGERFNKDFLERLREDTDPYWGFHFEQFDIRKGLGECVTLLRPGGGVPDRELQTCRRDDLPRLL